MGGAAVVEGVVVALAVVDVPKGSVLDVDVGAAVVVVAGVVGVVSVGGLGEVLGTVPVTVGGVVSGAIVDGSGCPLPAPPLSTLLVEPTSEPSVLVPTTPISSNGAVVGSNRSTARPAGAPRPDVDVVDPPEEPAPR